MRTAVDAKAQISERQRAETELHKLGVELLFHTYMNPIEESVESKLMWEGIKKYLHKLTPKECEVMISLYVDHLSVRETAAKLKVDDSTVSTHHKNARDKIRNAMEE